MSLEEKKEAASVAASRCCCSAVAEEGEEEGEEFVEVAVSDDDDDDDDKGDEVASTCDGNVALEERAGPLLIFCVARMMQRAAFFAWILARRGEPPRESDIVGRFKGRKRTVVS